MKVRLALIVTTLTMALTTTTPVEAEILEKWDFGRLPYGTEVKSKPSWAIDYSCDEEMVCSFYDPEHVKHLVWKDFLATKTFTVTAENHHLIPFDINYHDDPATIIKAVSVKTALTFECITHADNRHIEEGILFCSSYIEDMLSLNLEFNSDRKLKYVEVWSKYM